MELRPYADSDRWLTEALQSDPEVMSELGGPTPAEDLPATHARRLVAAASGWWFTIVPDAETCAVGTIGIFDSEWNGDAIREAGWMVLPAHQGRGHAGEALRMLLERACKNGLDTVHAFPGQTNWPSNALCRKCGFELVEEDCEIDYAGRMLRSNHWVVKLRT